MVRGRRRCGARSKPKRAHHTSGTAAPPSTLDTQPSTLLPVPPSLPRQILRGALGFALLSLAAFTPWIFGAGFFARTTGPLGMYLACLAIFLGLSGPLLHRLLAGPHSLARFYRLFAASFTAYAAAWIASYLTLKGLPPATQLLLAGGLALAWLAALFALSGRLLPRLHLRTDLPGLALTALYLAAAALYLWFTRLGHFRDATGLLLGTFLMALILARALRARACLPLAALLLFLTNCLGYFSADWLEHWILRADSVPFLGDHPTRAARFALAMPLWAILYGLAFGAGLGATFHLLQRPRPEAPAPIH